MKGKWKTCWAIPLAVVVAEVIEYAFSMWLMEFLRGRHPELMGHQAGAEEFAGLVDQYRLVFSIILLILMGLVLRRFLDRGALLRSAAVTAGCFAVIVGLSRLFPYSGVWIYLSLPWGPLTDLSGTLALWVGQSSAVLLQVSAVVFHLASPFLLVPFGKKDL